MNFNQHFGLELVERATFLRMYDFLNQAISEAETRWDASDQALASHMGKPYMAITIESIAPDNFYEGHRPSLIRAPIENYPNISIWGVRSTANAESAGSDHTNVRNNLVYIEVMCRATEDDGEGIISRRVSRTCEAVDAVMSSDQTLSGVVTSFEGEVVVNMSDVFTRKEKTSYGPVWYWQGARLEYTVRKDSRTPSTVPGSEFRSPGGFTEADQALIDQM